MTDKTTATKPAPKPTSPGGSADGQPAAAKQQKMRSPNYPAISLEAAVGKLDEAFPQMKRFAVGVEAAVKAMKLSYKSSSGKLTLAAMRAFGLFENSGIGMVKISTLGLDIAADYKRESAEWRKAVKEAALKPKIHQTLWEKYGPDLPMDDEVRRYLIRDLKFSDNAVGPLIAEYKATIAFAKLADGDKMPESASNGDEPDDDESPRPLSPHRPKARQMVAGMKEDVFSLDEGSVVLQWPERLSKISAQDLEDWLALIGRKIKRAAEAPPEADDSGQDEDEQSGE